MIRDYCPSFAAKDIVWKIFITVPEVIMANNGRSIRLNFCFRFNVRKYLVAGRWSRN